MITARENDKDFPWWLVFTASLAAYLFYRIFTNDLYTQIQTTLLKGAGITIFVTLVAFSLACAMGLLLALGSMSRHLILRQLSRFYIEIIRGIPILVLLLYVAFVLAPAMVEVWNWLATLIGLEPMRTRDFSLLWRAIIALSIAYSAFIAEVFRAGLQAVDPGQIEAAKALGLSGWQRFRHVVFPQAFRTILPPLGNDFVAMVKDSSLVSVLGVADIAQLGKVIASGNFRYFETYNVVALNYLMMTITLSLLLRRLERRLRNKIPERCRAGSRARQCGRDCRKPRAAHFRKHDRGARNRRSRSRSPARRFPQSRQRRQHRSARIPDARIRAEAFGLFFGSLHERSALAAHRCALASARNPRPFG